MWTAEIRRGKKERRKIETIGQKICSHLLRRAAITSNTISETIQEAHRHGSNETLE